MNMTKEIPFRKLGSSGISVSALGLGCMGMTYAYGPFDDAENLRVLHRYLERGGNFLDTAEIYGPFTNEELLGRFLKEVDRSRIVLATKFGVPPLDDDVDFDSSPEAVRRSCEGSLRRLGVDHIDLYYQHRMDPGVPIEDTVGAMAELVREGKVRFLGLSEAPRDLLRRADAIHPITALQTEYSLWTRDIESNGILKTCRELNIAFVAYSPLGRGFLTGKIQAPSDLDALDWRRNNPRFTQEAFKQNLLLVEVIEAMAKSKECTPAQLALAWVLSQGDDIIPIPGTKRVHWLEENMDACQIALTEQEKEDLRRQCAAISVVGERYA